MTAVIGALLVGMMAVPAGQPWALGPGPWAFLQAQAPAGEVITEIDVTQTLKGKIGVDFRPYRILGACNPTLAHEALKLEDKVGTMLPCNVIVQELAPGRIEVAAIDPVASMAAIDNPALLKKAAIVRGTLETVIESL